jgi:hypothetical protein
MLKDFLSSHTSKQIVVSIHVEPEVVYLVEEKDSLILNFDFILKGLTEKNLLIKFIKVAVYDKEDKLITFQHLNHNGVGNPSIHTLGKFDLEGKKNLDVFNPFFRFSKDISISYLRYMFTFADQETGEEFYYGNVLIKPVKYEQRVQLSLPLKGKMVILDGNDFYSHHRRVAISILKEFTRGIFKSNFNRFGLDFSILGNDGNLREMSEDEKDKNYDFHITDVKKFYTHETPVYAPADGEIVDFVDDLEDLYEISFDIEAALAENRIKDLAGNYIVIKHNESEFSHLFHLLKGSCKVKSGDFVKRDEEIAKVGFSGASTVYSHLHYQLLDGNDLLNSKELPIKFSNVILCQGSEKISYNEFVLNTGDIFQRKV